jgi:Trk K+ transport system NAD-binding subunit
MHIIIMGMSVFGLNLASLLVHEGQDVVLIEENEIKCNKFADKLLPILF